MALEGSERKLLHAIVREQGNAQAGYVEDSKIAEIAYLSIEEVRDCLETLEGKECVQRSVGVGGHSAYITAKGRQELRRSQVIIGDEDERAESPLKIVPKGLRSFDAEDKDFFLDLLPGPRRGDGLPESVHFWKVRIEEMDPDKTFRVATSSAPAAAASRPSSKRVCSLVCPSPSSPSTSRRRARILKPDCSEDWGSSTPTCLPTSISAPLWSLRGRESGRDQTRSCS